MREHSQGYSFSTISTQLGLISPREKLRNKVTCVPPTTFVELPFTPQSLKFSSTVLWTNVVVVVSVVEVVPVVPEMEMMSAEASAELSPELPPELSVVVVVVAPGNIDGQIAAPIAPMAIPTGKAMDSSWRVSLLRESLISTAVVEGVGEDGEDGEEGEEGEAGVTMSRPISSAQTAA